MDTRIFIGTAGQNKSVIKEYINQLEEDYTRNQIVLKEYVDPFTGSKNK